MSKTKGLAVVALLASSYVLATPAPWASASSKTIQIAGIVQCKNGSQQVEGVWVNSSKGGSKFATWIWAGYTSTSKSTYAAYTASLSVSSTPTTVQLRIGCGGSSSTWGSTNTTASKSVSGSTLISATCANPSTANHANKQTCSIASNGSDSGASASALWALSKIKATSSGGDTPNGHWAGYCADFVGRAWGRSDAGYSTASAMYSGFKASGRTPSTSSSTPVGALAFYKLDASIDPPNGTDGHVNINAGLGVFVSTKGSVGDTYPIVAYRVSQYENSDRQYLGWMMPPSGWRAR